MIPVLVLTALAAQPLTFTNQTSSRIVATTSQGGGLDKEYALGDIDNDGDLDVVLAIAEGIFGRRNNVVYRNDGGVLTEITQTAVPEFWNDTLSRRSFLEDLDADGWLDLIVVNDTIAGGYAGDTHLWMNNHPGGVFQGFVQEDARLRGAGGASCGGDMQDYDLDGDVDLYVGNYPGPSQDTFYLNDSNGFFTDVTSQFVPTDSDYTVDVISADFNNDGTLDVAVSNHFNPTFVYYNNLRGQSVDGDFSTPGSVQLLIQRTDLHNANEALDVDGDGDMDLYHANWDGTVDYLLVNDGLTNGVVTWTPTPISGPQSQRESSKPQRVDIDQDGRDDLIVPGMDGGPVLLRNTSINGVPSFIDWTPPAFRDIRAYWAFSTAVFDTDQDGALDVVVWGESSDHVFAGSPAPGYVSSSLGGTLPNTQAGPVVIEGSGVPGDRNLLIGPDVPGHTVFATITSACGDVRVRAAHEGGGSRRSDRGTMGNVETTYLTGTTGRIGVAVDVVRACGDWDADGDVDQLDFRRAARCVNNPTAGCLAVFDADLDGVLTPADQQILLADSRGDGVPAETRYTLEVLTR